MAIGASLTIMVLTHLHEKDVVLARSDGRNPIYANNVGVKVTEDHDIPGMFGAGLTGPCQHTSLGSSARKKSPGETWSDVAVNADIDCDGTVSKAQKSRAEIVRCLFTHHVLPVACGKVDRRLGEASKSSADLTDHATKSLVVLNSPGGLQRLL